MILDHHRSGFGHRHRNGRYDGQYTEDALGPGPLCWPRAGQGQSDRDRGSAQRAHNGTWGGGAAGLGAAAERAYRTPRWRPIPTCWSLSRESTYQGQRYWWDAISQALYTGRRTWPIGCPPHAHPNSGLSTAVFQATDFGPASLQFSMGLHLREQRRAGLHRRVRHQTAGPSWTTVVRGDHLLHLRRSGQQRHRRHPGRAEDMSGTHWAWNPNPVTPGGFWPTTGAPSTEQDGLSDPDRVQQRGVVASTATFTVTLSAPSARQVMERDCRGTATAGIDYNTASGVVTFAPARSGKTTTISVLHDSIAEGSEAFDVVVESVRSHPPPLTSEGHHRRPRARAHTADRSR